MTYTLEYHITLVILLITLVGFPMFLLWLGWLESKRKGLKFWTNQPIDKEVTE